MKKKWYFRKFNEAEKRMNKVNIECKHLMNEDAQLTHIPVMYNTLNRHFAHMPKEFSYTPHMPYIEGMFHISHRNNKLFKDSSKDYIDPLPAKMIIEALRENIFKAPLSDIIKPVKIEAGEYDRTGTIAGHINFEFFDRGYFHGNTLDIIIEYMKSFGYHIGYYFVSNKDGIKVYHTQFEPYKFHSGMIIVPNHVFHVTNMKAAFNIDKNGFKATSDYIVP